MSPDRSGVAERQLQRMDTALPAGVRLRLALQRMGGRPGDARGTTRLRLAALALAVAATVVALVVGARAVTATPTMTIRADFSEAPGIYQGNHVDVLGIPVGTVTAVHAGAAHAVVTMVVPRSLKVPATADAVLMAPDVVSDRYIELTPVYRGGARLRPGTTIPERRTVVPLSLDQILNTFDELARALGPNGANRNGAVAGLVHQLALQLNGNGPALHRAIAALGPALGALQGKGPSLTQTLDNLAALTTSANQADQTYQAFAATAATVAQTLAADRTSLGGALADLQQALGRIDAFVQQNRSTLTGTVDNLQSVVSALAQDQGQLARAWTVAPLAFENFAGAIDPHAPGGPALVTTINVQSDSLALVNQICGSSQLRATNLAVKQTQASELDVACDASSGLASLPPPPGSSTGPPLSEASLAGGGS